MTPLQKLAQTINDLAKKEADTRKSLCMAIAAAQDMVKRESNMTFRQWADRYLRQADGSKWALGTLYKMAMFGRNPDKLEDARKEIAERGRSDRRAFQARYQPAAPAMPKPNVQFRRLLDAWTNADVEIQIRFMRWLEKNAPEEAKRA